MEKRYKVRGTDKITLKEIEDFLRSNDVYIYCISERFNFVSVGELTTDILLRLYELNAKVVDDFQYDICESLEKK